MKHVTWIWIAILLFLLVASPFGCSQDEIEDKATPFSEQERKWLAAHPVIRLAPDPDYPPIEYFDENGEYRGVTADYIELISQKLGIHFEIVHLRNWDEAIEKAKSRQIDMWSAATKTPQRTEYMLFTFPYIDLPSVIIVEKSVKEILTLEKISRMRVAVVSGYADHELIAYSYPELDLVVVPDVQTGLKKVSFGTVDAFVTQLATATYYIEKEGITNLRIAGETDYAFKLALASRNDWPELNQILEKGLAQISEEERQAIYEKWVRLEQGPLLARKELWIPVLGSLGVVILVIAGILVWNRSLKQQVNRKTKELQNELAQRKKTEETLSESEKKYSTVVQQARDGIIIVQDEVIVFTNNALREISGFSGDDLLGKKFLDLMSPESRALVAQRYQDRLEGKETTVTYEIKLKCKDGTIKDVEASAGVIQYQGSQAMLAIVRDITGRKQVEEEIVKFKLIADSADYGVVIRSRDSTFSYVNESFAAMHGYTRNELIGQHYSILFNDEQKAVVDGMTARQMKTNKSISQELWRIRKDGTSFLSYAMGTVVQDEKGKPLFIASTVMDITERKQAENALRVSELKYSAIVDSAKEAIISVDSQGKIISWNSGAVNIFGYSVEEALNENITILIPHEIHDVFGKIFEQMASTESSRNTGIQNREFVGVRKGGDRFPAEISISSWQTEDEIFLSSIVRDITERKLAEEEIRKFKTIADNATYGVTITGIDGYILYLNKAHAEMHGYTIVELIGKHYSILYTEEQVKIVEENRKVLFQKGHLVNEEWRTRKDGTTFSILTTRILIRDEGGQPLYIATTHFDLTEQKKMQEQLIVTDRLASIGELVSGVAHELNNPLTGVIGFSDMLAERKDLPDEVKEDLETINREAQRSANIVKNLLTFARKHSKEKQATDIHKAIEAVLELRAYEQKVNNIQVNTRFSSDLPEIMANSFDLQQVFLNIIVNAEHAMLGAHGKGIITVTTKQDGDIIRVYFADDGPGIAKENLEHLFDPFFTTKEVGKGTGLGLSICHGTVSEHNGRIFVESEPGKGATFIVELPLATTSIEGTANGKSRG